MSSTVSDTDLKLFLNLSNSDKINEKNEKIDEEDLEDETDEEGEEDDDEDDIDEEEEGEEDDDAPEELPDLSGPARSSVSRAAAAASAETPASAAMTPEELDYAKTAVLLELDRLRSLGCRVREYTMDDNLETMEYEARRHVLQMEEMNSVNTLKDGLRLFVSGAEFANDKFGPFLNLEGFSQSVSKDLTVGKYNLTLSKLHRKYFKTPGESSPEMELAFALMGAAAMHHFQRSVLTKMMPTGASSLPRSGAMAGIPPAADDDSDDEELPPSFNVGA